MKRSVFLALGVLAAVGMGFAVAQPGQGGGFGGGRGGHPGGGPGGGPGGPGGHPPRPHHPPVLFMVIDVDTNGELSAEEIADASTQILTLDADSNGVITLDELRPPKPAGDGSGSSPGNGGPSGSMIDRLDTDGDGLVSLAEFLVPAQDMFDSIDADDDGYVSEDEAAAAGPGCPPPPPADGDDVSAVQESDADGIAVEAGSETTSNSRGRFQSRFRN